MPHFQLHDTVVLKADRSLVGTIDRTSYLDSEPLDDCLIIAHSLVPEDILSEFLKFGTPPRGYVFVIFAEQEQGCSLVHEDDLLLLDRVLDLGDVVKQDGSQLLGTVTDVSSTYVIAPVWRNLLTSQFPAQIADLSAPRAHRCTSVCDPSSPFIQYPRPYELIHNVPFEELKRAQDFFEGDYVISDEWLGVVDECQRVVVLLLENNAVVVVSEPEELQIPIPDYGKRVLSLPEYDDVRRPDFISTMQGWDRTISPEDNLCGQFVVTGNRNISRGRFLHGSYDPSVKPQGRVLMVRTATVTVRWLVCNPFANNAIVDLIKPAVSAPYENIETFPQPQEIRRNKKLALYDPSRRTTEVENRMRLSSGNGTESESLSKPVSPANLSSTFNVGDRVKFRDAAGAAVKYAGGYIGGVLHGGFDRVIPHNTFGYDLNEFKIIECRQSAKVRWQDGSTSFHVSTSLAKFNLFESDLVPGDLVVAREGMKQISEKDTSNPKEIPSLKDFNEMTFFEKPHDLLPAKVGTVQNVHPNDRVAQIRWFSTPKIRITSFGNALGAESRFGPLSDDVEDVSLYEVMSFPGLTRRLRDIVLIPPQVPLEDGINRLKHMPSHPGEEYFAMTALSQIGDTDVLSMLEWLQYTAKASIQGDEPRKLIDYVRYKQRRLPDWVGEIVHLGTDGKLMVRIDAKDHCRDVMLEHDQLICFVDDAFALPDMSDTDDMDMDQSDDTERTSQFSDMSLDIISETVEYEGGKRLDDDSDDANWESEEEVLLGDESAKNKDDLIDRTEGRKSVALPIPTNAEHANESIGGSHLSHVSRESLTVLRSHLTNEEPEPFAVLDREAPQDQFRQSHQPSTSSSFLKRIAKEHRILSSALPKHEIYVRTYENRLDLLRCLIIGPADTPYEFAPFLIDLHLGPTFPDGPPTAHFHSWTSGLGRINPNLYEEGKICLSLLGTWPGKSETESWSEKATILQLLVSLQGLVFVKAPFYNEAGFEDAETEGQYKRESFQYSEKAFVMARSFVKHVISSPVKGLEDVLAWLYLLHENNHGVGLIHKTIDGGNALIAKSEETRKRDDQDGDILLDGAGGSNDKTKVFLKPLSKGAVVMLRKTIKNLQALVSAK